MARVRLCPPACGLAFFLLLACLGWGQRLLGQTTPPSTTVLAQTALDNGDYATCLTYLGSLPAEQRASARNQWILVRCLQANVEAAPNDARVAAACLMACQRYIDDMRTDPKANANVAIARKWRDALRKRYGYDGMRHTGLHYADIPTDQRTLLDSVEQVLTALGPDDFQQWEGRLYQHLKDLPDLSLPMRNGHTPFTFCIARDAVEPMKALLYMTRDGVDQTELQNRVLAAAVAGDALGITEYLLNFYLSRTYDLEASLVKLAVEHKAYRVLKYWFDANRNNDGRLVALNEWNKLAPLYPTQLANAAVHTNDTTMLSYAARYGIAPDSLGDMVFSAMEARDPHILDILLRADPPADARDAQGMSYLHRAMAMDAPELLEVLRKHGWFERLEHALDNDGMPAPHYLVTRDLPKVLKTPDLLQHLHMETTDTEGFGLLHRLVFRPDSMAIPAEAVMEAVLKNTKHLKLNAQGPHHGWTALHYAARENKPKLVALLVKGGRADKRQKDSTWKRTPKDVAKDMAREHGQRGPLKAM